MGVASLGALAAVTVLALVRVAGLKRELVELRSRVAEAPFHDRITGLADRGQLALEHRAWPPGTVGTLVVMDLDDFCGLNDAYGHAVSDQVLREMADRLRREARTEDFVARLGGDEFALLLKGADISAARAVATRLLAGLDEPMEILGRSVFVRARIGIATSDGDGSLETLLLHATTALQAAKTETPADGIAVFDARSHHGIVENHRLANDLRAALPRREFRLHYQPIVELESRRVIGFEALLRWRHPVLGEIPPMNFIMLAEEAGLMPAIGEWILETAAREAAGWGAGSAPSPYVSVNLSVRQIQDRDFLVRFDRAMASGGLPPERLVVEMTETAIAEELDLVSSKLEVLRSRGVRVYIDDFGTGYSSLSYIRDLPLDGVKLDRAFSQDIVASPDAWSLAQAVVSMLSHLHLAITAEGVETAAQLAQLRSLGCLHAQGYYFGRPRPAGESATPLTGETVEALT